MRNEIRSCIENITPKHNGKTMNNPDNVCDILLVVAILMVINGYFTNVALEIGNKNILCEKVNLHDDLRCRKSC